MVEEPKKRVLLDLWEVKRLLGMFEDQPQQMEDKELWLKLKQAEVSLMGTHYHLHGGKDA